MNTKYFMAAMVLFTSAFSYANYYHPVTGDLVIDKDSFSFSRDCNNTEAFISDRGIDMIYDSLFVEGRGSKSCFFRFGIAVPEGWYVKVSSSASITGSYSGKGVVTLEQVLAGTTNVPVFEYFDGVGTYSIKPNDLIVRTECGISEQLKILTSITSLLPSGYVDVVGGSIKYSFSWYRC